jgi:hypothetical protein
MLILPSGVRGAPAMGWFNHWARIETSATTQVTTIHNRDQALRRIVEAPVLKNREDRRQQYTIIPGCLRQSPLPRRNLSSAVPEPSPLHPVWRFVSARVFVV